MNNKTYITLAVIVAILAFAFYWFEYKPTKIKERCSAEAHFDTRATSESDDGKRQTFINSYYADCLMRFGVEE